MTEVVLGLGRTRALRMPWQGSGLEIVLDRNDTLSLQIDGRGKCLKIPDITALETARLTFSWDITRGSAELGIERPDRHSFDSFSVPVPVPLLLTQDVLRKTKMHGDFLAISDVVEPLGPQPGLLGDAPVRTEIGFVRIKDLKRGQRIATSQGSFEPVLEKIARRVPARGRFMPFSLRAPYLELQQDVIVSADQRIELRGSEVEYNFGQEAVFVAARALANGRCAHRAPAEPFVTYYQVVLAGHDCIEVAGASLESLYIGRIRRHPGKLNRSLLRGAGRTGLPEHRGIKHLALRPFDAAALLDQRAA